MNRRHDTSYVTVAEKLGVGYNHLYRVLHCQRPSPAVILTIERLYPELIQRQNSSIRQSLLSQCDFHRIAYKWDSKLNRYVSKKKYLNKWKSKGEQSCRHKARRLKGSSSQVQ